MIYVIIIHKLFQSYFPLYQVFRGRQALQKDLILEFCILRLNILSPKVATSADSPPNFHGSTAIGNAFLSWLKHQQDYYGYISCIQHSVAGFPFMSQCRKRSSSDTVFLIHFHLSRRDCQVLFQICVMPLLCDTSHHKR